MTGFGINDIFGLASYAIRKRKPAVEESIPTVADLEAELGELYPSETAENPPEVAELTDNIQTPEKTAPAPSLEAEEGISKGTACLQCCLDHYSTCAGLISDEAIRMARRNGVEDQEVINRILSCRSQLNAMEREDLRAEKIVELPDWEKEIAILAQNESATIRHKLSEVKTAEDLESVAIQINNDYRQIGQMWLKGRIAQMNPEARQKLEEKTKELLGQET